MLRGVLKPLAHRVANPMDTAFAERFPLYGARQNIRRDSFSHVLSRGYTAN